MSHFIVCEIKKKQSFKAWQNVNDTVPSFYFTSLAIVEKSNPFVILLHKTSCQGNVFYASVSRSRYVSHSVSTVVLEYSFETAY